MKKLLIKIKTNYERSLIKKNLDLKQELKQIKKEKQDLIKENHDLYDKITLQQNEYRELDLKQRNLIKKLKTSELFNELIEVIK
jgi:hypothetical protein